MSGWVLGVIGGSGVYDIDVVQLIDFAAAVDLHLTGLPAAVTRAKLTQYRIDAEHSNSYTAWLRLGSPAHPTPAQYAELDKSGQLALLGTPENIRIDHGSTLIQLQLPRQAVSLLVLEW